MTTGSLSTYGEAMILDTVFGSSADNSWPENLYIALFATVPDDTGLNGTEVATSGTGYSRLMVANNGDNFDFTPTSTAGESVKGVKSNKTTWVFPTSVAAWGEIKGAGIYDDNSGGHLLWVWEWAQPRVVAANDTMRVEAGEIQFTFNKAGEAEADCVLSFALQRKLLDAFFGAPTAPEIPTALYAALMTVAPGADELSEPGVELPLGVHGYQRAMIGNSPELDPEDGPPCWLPTAYGVKTNGQPILWPQSLGSWSGVTAIAFYDGPVPGAALIAKCRPGAVYNWLAGDQPRIVAGGMRLHAD